VKQKVLIDLLKLDNLYCGLGQVSLHFGNAISKISHPDIEWNFLVPENYIGYFGSEITYHTLKSIKNVTDIKLWHATHQEPKLLPQKLSKILLTVHDLNFLGEKTPAKAKKRLQKLQQNIDKINAISFISNYSQTIANQHIKIKKDVPQFVVYNGINIEDKQTSPNICNQDFFFSIGVLKPKKNFHVLLPMMEEFENTHLIIAGSNKSSYAVKLKKEIKRRNLKDRIHIVGTISEAEKNWLYSHCKAFLFPSLHEGFGLPLIEALYFGKPVICYNGTSLPEIGKQHVFYWHDFDSITMKNQVLSAIKAFKNSKTVDNAIAYAQEFNWAKNANDYLKIYLEILGKN
jgi:glycosyltransferase involved in cell wall biosynthesis